MKKKKTVLSRREFVRNSAAMAAAVSAAGIMSSFVPAHADQKIPTRLLGKTGMDVSVLTFGGGSQFLLNPDGVWEQLLETAVESGINLFDTAPSYVIENRQGSGKIYSEDRFGQVLPRYRNRIYISTKLESREAGMARSELEASLKRLKTDYVDILYIHGITPEDTTSGIEKGVYKGLAALKAEGLVRNIAFSSMDSAERSRELLEKLDFDVALLAINATNYGDFAGIALPAARARNTGVIAMKVMRDIVGKKATSTELLAHALSLPGIATAVIGHKGIEILRENIAIAKGIGKSDISDVDRVELESRMASLAGPHVLSWARPGYRDAGIALS
jgi:aryl-alcohol dehydrogenase-like predicted oxidoreductase